MELGVYFLSEVFREASTRADIWEPLPSLPVQDLRRKIAKGSEFAVPHENKIRTGFSHIVDRGMLL